MVICGLDNIEARQWMSKKLESFVTMEDGVVDPSTIIPMIDGGTEGFKGQTHVILPYMNPSFTDRMWLFPKRQSFNMDTACMTPRKPEHCVAYVPTQRAGARAWEGQAGLLGRAAVVPSCV